MMVSDKLSYIRSRYQKAENGKIYKLHTSTLQFLNDVAEASLRRSKINKKVRNEM